MKYPQLIKKADNFRNSGQIDAAIAFYNQASNRALQEKKYLIAAQALHMKGVIYSMGILAKADECYTRSLDALYQSHALYEKLGDTYYQGIVERDMGIAYTHAKEYSLAQEHLLHSISLTIQDHAQTAISYDKLGWSYALSENFTQAEEYIHKALSLLDQTKNTWFYKATTLLDYARLLYCTHSYTESLTTLTKAHTILLRHSEHQERRFIQIYQLYSLLYVRLQDPVKVQEYTKKYLDLMEEIRGVGNSALLQELQQVIDLEINA